MKSCFNCKYVNVEVGEREECYGLIITHPDTYYCTHRKYFNANTTDKECTVIMEQTNWGANCEKWEIENA